MRDVCLLALSYCLSSDLQSGVTCEQRTECAMSEMYRLRGMAAHFDERTKRIAKVWIHDRHSTELYLPRFWTYVQICVAPFSRSRIWFCMALCFVGYWGSQRQYHLITVNIVLAKCREGVLVADAESCSSLFTSMQIGGNRSLTLLHSHRVTTPYLFLRLPNSHALEHSERIHACLP